MEPIARKLVDKGGVLQRAVRVAADVLYQTAADHGSGLSHGTTVPTLPGDHHGWQPAAPAPTAASIDAPRAAASPSRLTCAATCRGESLNAMRLFLATLIFAGTAFAQTMSDDEVAAVFNRISRRAARLEPMLEQLHVNDWIAKGAPDTYLAQWNSIRQQYTAVQSDLSDLTRSAPAVWKIP